MKDKKQPAKPAETKMPAIVDEASLLSDLRSLIQSARQRIAAVAYTTQTLLWDVRPLRLHQAIEHAREHAARLTQDSGEQP